MKYSLTHNCELGAGDMWTTHHPVVALVSGLAVLDLQKVAVTTDADAMLFTVVQFLGALIPRQGDLRVVDGDLALKQSLLVDEGRLVTNVFHHRHGLQGRTNTREGQEIVLLLLLCYNWTIRVVLLFML